MSDLTCDAAIESIFRNSGQSVGQDLLQSLLDHVGNHPEGDAAKDFLDSLNQPPPAGICVSAGDVELARTFFLDYAVQIMQALLHYSLAAGFARFVGAIFLLQPKVKSALLVPELFVPFVPCRT